MAGERYTYHCRTYSPNYFAQEVIMDDLLMNGLALVLSVAGYVAAPLAVIIVRWVISGFKKNN